MLINSSGHAKIADFGISKDMDSKNQIQNLQEFNQYYALYLTAMMDRMKRDSGGAITMETNYTQFHIDTPNQ